MDRARGALAVRPFLADRVRSTTTASTDTAVITIITIIIMTTDNDNNNNIMRFDRRTRAICYHLCRSEFFNTTTAVISNNVILRENIYRDVYRGLDLRVHGIYTRVIIIIILLDRIII